MSDLTAAKEWMLSAAMSPGEPLHFLSEDDVLIDLDGLSPVEQLIGAASSCFAQSCLALMQFHGMPPSPLRVHAWGHKPKGPLMGKGLDQLTLTITFADTVDPSRRRKLLDDTKKICTVTNSLSATMEIKVALHEVVTEE